MAGSTGWLRSQARRESNMSEPAREYWRAASIILSSKRVWTGAPTGASIPPCPSVVRYVKNGGYVAGSKTGQRIGMLELKAFGGLRLEVDGAPYGGIAARPKTLGLLALLAPRPNGLSRGQPRAYLLPRARKTRGRPLLQPACP